MHEDLLELGKFFGPNARGGAESERRFQHLAKIQQFADQLFLALPRVSQRIDQRVRRYLANNRARALPRLTMPVNSRLRIASRIELRLSPSDSAKSRSEGSLSPGCNFFRIRRSICLATPS